MNKLARFNGYGLEDEEDKQQGLDETTDNSEPPANNEELDSTGEPATSETGGEDESSIETPTEETDDLEIKEDDSEEVVEEKEKKIKIEIEIAQEQIAQMTDAVASLEGICKQMEDSLQRGGLNVQGRMIAKTSVQHIAKQFGINQTKTSSLESYGYQLDDFHATKISIESISETIVKIYNWIRDKIKAIYNFFFKREKAEEIKIEKTKEKNKEKETKVSKDDKDKYGVEPNPTAMPNKQYQTIVKYISKGHDPLNMDEYDNVLNKFNIEMGKINNGDYTNIDAFIEEWKNSGEDTKPVEIKFYSRKTGSAVEMLKYLTDKLNSILTYGKSFHQLTNKTIKTLEDREVKLQNDIKNIDKKSPDEKEHIHQELKYTSEMILKITLIGNARSSYIEAMNRACSGDNIVIV